MTSPAGSDAERLRTILAETAALEIIPRFRDPRPGQIRQKSGPLDLVTEADEAAERMIARRLREAFPGIVVVGEEEVARDHSILDHLVDAPLAAVVDPIDGTANFAAGVPLFGSMAALIRNQEIVASAIHCPLGQDSAVAERGGGAWLVSPGRDAVRLQVADPAPLEDVTGKAAPRHFPPEIASRLSVRLLGLLAAWDYRCAAHEYRMAVSGGCHFLLYSSTMPWDHAPGMLLHREAGGHARRLDGREYRVTERTGGLLCAPDERSWHSLRDRLFDE